MFFLSVESNPFFAQQFRACDFFSCILFIAGLIINAGPLRRFRWSEAPKWSGHIASLVAIFILFSSNKVNNTCSVGRMRVHSINYDEKKKTTTDEKPELISPQ